MDKDARDLYRAVSELVRVYQFRDRHSTCYYDLSVTQCHALSSILRQEPMTVNALADELLLDKSTASRVVASLVEKGYALRSTDPDDGRVARIEATVEGRALHAKIERDLVDGMKALITDYDPATRRATVQLIGRLAENAALRFKTTGQGPC